MNRRRRRKANSKGEGKFRRRKKWEYIASAFDNRCIYCDVQPSSYELSCDRIIPKSHGGTAIFWNIVPACIPCNSIRSNATIVDYIQSVGINLKDFQGKWAAGAIKLFGKYLSMRRVNFTHLHEEFTSLADHELFMVLEQLFIDEKIMSSFIYWPLKYGIKLLQEK